MVGQVEHALVPDDTVGVLGTDVDMVCTRIGDLKARVASKGRARLLARAEEERGLGLSHEPLPME